MESEQPYYDGDDYGGRVLWGRVAFFGVALLLAFVAGRCSGGGVPPDQLAVAEDRIEQLESDKKALEEEVQALQESADQGDEVAAADEDDGGQPVDEQPTDEGSADDSSSQEKTHIVERGDTLSGLAERYYGDKSKHDLITDANGIDKDNPLQVGQELVIPPDPGS